jgi:hypothetical protein
MTELRVAPNPMSRFAHLEVTSPIAMGSPAVRLQIVDVGGRMVRSLEVERRDATTGTASWDRRDASGTLVPGGVYFVQLDASNAPGVRSRRIVVIP